MLIWSIVQESCNDHADKVAAHFLNINRNKTFNEILQWKQKKILLAIYQQSNRKKINNK